MRYSHRFSNLKILNLDIRAYIHLALLLLLASLPAHALEQPKGEVLLTIGGNITVSNATENNQPVAKFDLDLLKSLGQTSYTTSSPWTEENEFTGVRLNTLLEAVGVDHKNTVIRATASNDYWFDLKGLPLDEYPIMIAYEQNGNLIALRERGPLWIVFPWDLHPSLLDSQKNKSSSVWQLISLTVK